MLCCTDGDEGIWVPTGDDQLDSLLRLKAAVDKNNLLTGWTVNKGKNAAFCGWDFVVCDEGGKTVEVRSSAGSNAGLCKAQCRRGRWATSRQSCQQAALLVWAKLETTAACKAQLCTLQLLVYPSCNDLMLCHAVVCHADSEPDDEQR